MSSWPGCSVGAVRWICLAGDVRFAGVVSRCGSYGRLARSSMRSPSSSPWRNLLKNPLPRLPRPSPHRRTSTSRAASRPAKQVQLPSTAETPATAQGWIVTMTGSPANNVSKAPGNSKAGPTPDKRSSSYALRHTHDWATKNSDSSQLITEQPERPATTRIFNQLNS